MIKESIEYQKEKLKYRRINEDEPYEDGDNFDSHIGKYKYITNPYALLEKMETDLSSSDDESESDKEQNDPEIGVGNKRKHQEAFDKLIMFKKPEDKKPTVTSTIALMKRVKYDEDKPKEVP
jgi:hypothetical protein